MAEVVVLGGGYAGLATAQGLARRGFRVTLIERRERHELLTLLPEVVAGRKSASDAGIPYTTILRRGIQWVQSEATHVDLPRRQVTVSEGIFAGDWLVIAAGAVPGHQDIPGAREYGRTVRSIADAVKLRAALLDLQRLHARARIVVVGAGYTGTEIAGELASWSGGAGSGRAFEVTLVAADPRLLAQGHAELGDIAARVLAQKGVTLLLGRTVSRVDKDAVALESGESLSTDLLVWAAPAEISPSVRPHGIASTIDGRYCTNEYLQVAGASRVYAAGDIASIRDPGTGRPIASSGQLAIQAGAHVAAAIAREASGLPARRFHPLLLGEALSLGGSDGAADVLGLIVTGRLALAAKEAALQRYLLALRGARLRKPVTDRRRSAEPGSVI